MASDTTNKVMGEDWKKCGRESTTEPIVIKTTDCDVNTDSTSSNRKCEERQLHRYMFKSLHGEC